MKVKYRLYLTSIIWPFSAFLSKSNVSCSGYVDHIPLLLLFTFQLIGKLMLAFFIWFSKLQNIYTWQLVGTNI